MNPQSREREGTATLGGSITSKSGRRWTVQELLLPKGVQLEQQGHLVARVRNRMSVVIRIGGPTLVALAKLAQVLLVERLWQVPPRRLRMAEPRASGRTGVRG